MPGTPLTLTSTIAIVNATTGIPNEFFIRWAQQRQIDIENAVTSSEVAGQISTALKSISILTTPGSLTGGGDLSQSRTLDLAVIPGLTPGPYTNSNITVDKYGRVTVVANGSGGGGGGFYDISAGVPNQADTIEVGPVGVFTYKYNGNSGRSVQYSTNYSGGADCFGGWSYPRSQGTPWDIAVLVGLNEAGAQYFGPMLGLYNSITQKAITVAPLPHYGQFQLRQWNSPGSFSSIPFSGKTSPTGGFFWLHLSDDGAGNITFGFSLDGANPVTITTTTLASFIGTYDSICFGMFCEGGTTGYSVPILCLDMFASSRKVGA